MNGAESIVQTLISGGVHVCFTNPGTSEMHLVAALDRQQHIQCVLGLSEGGVTAAADGYARMTGRPACTLLHLGPGFANGLANLHNASRAHTPMVNLIGQHALSHLGKGSPLDSDIEAIAKPYSKWIKTTMSAHDAGRDVAEALVISRTSPGQIASLIVPADVAWEPGGQTAVIPQIPLTPLAAEESIAKTATMLRSGLPTALILGGNSLFGKGLFHAGQVASVSNAKLLVPYPFPRLERGAGRPVVDRIPYMPQQATELLKQFRQLILVGVHEPVAYFAAPGRRPELAAQDCQIHQLAKPEEDCSRSLEALLSILGRGNSGGFIQDAFRPPRTNGQITIEGLAQGIAAILPENAIVIDESMTAGRGIMAAAAGAGPHDWLANTGGSIGIAMPLAVGAALASRSRRVLCLSADGSGMYTLQALWTMAREGLNVTVVIFANRAYNILRREFASLGVGQPEAIASALFNIGHPDLDWVSLGKGMGVPSSRAQSLEDFCSLAERGLTFDGPALIEVNIEN
jgi:acetolactate synthase I/II/III large subunit